MSLAMLAAYKTLKPNFQIHHLTAQFLAPGTKNLPLIFYVARTSDKGNNATRVVSVFQDGVVIDTMTMAFERQLPVESLTMSYQSQIPGGISPPIDDGLNDLKWIYNGLIHGQNVKRKMSMLKRKIQATDKSSDGTRKQTLAILSTMQLASG